MDSDYEEDVDDIAKDTCVDPSANWAGFEVPEINEEEDKSESDVDEKEEMVSLAGTDEDEDAPYQRPKKFVRKKYPEFNPDIDMRNPIFKAGQLFSIGKCLEMLLGLILSSTERRLSLTKMRETR